MAYIPSSESPSAYVFSADGLMLDLPGGLYMMVDGGSSKFAFTKHVKELGGVVVTAPTRSGLTNALEQNQNARIVPIAGHIPSLPDPSSAPEGSLRALAASVLSQNKDRHRPILPIKYNPKFEPFTLHSSLLHGQLSLYVLDGGQKDNLETLAKALQKGDDAVEKAAIAHGMIVVLVWQPAKLDEPIKRVLYTGNAPYARVAAALEKAHSLGILFVRSVSSHQARDGVALPARARPAPSSRLGSSSSTTAPSRAPATTRPVAIPRAPVAARTTTTTTSATRTTVGASRVGSARPPASSTTTSRTATAARPAASSTATSTARRPTSTVSSAHGSVPQSPRTAAGASTKKTVGTTRAAVPASRGAASSSTRPAPSAAAPKRTAAPAAKQTGASRVAATNAASAAPRAIVAPNMAAAAPPVVEHQAAPPPVEASKAAEQAQPEQQQSLDDSIVIVDYSDNQAPPPRIIIIDDDEHVPMAVPSVEVNLIPPTPEPPMSPVLVDHSGEEEEEKPSAPMVVDEPARGEEASVPVAEIPNEEDVLMTTAMEPEQETRQEEHEDALITTAIEPEQLEHELAGEHRQEEKEHEVPTAATVNEEEPSVASEHPVESTTAAASPPSHPETPEVPEKKEEDPKEPTPTPAEFVAPHVPQPVGENGLLDDLEEPPRLKKISMDTDRTLEEGEIVREGGEEERGVGAAVMDTTDRLMCQAMEELDLNHTVTNNTESAAEVVRKMSQQMVDDASLPFTSALASSISQKGAETSATSTLDDLLGSFTTAPSSNVTETPTSDAAPEKIRPMQTRSSVVENGDDHREVKYEETDPVLDLVLDSVATASEQVDRHATDLISDAPKENDDVTSGDPSIGSAPSSEWTRVEAFNPADPLLMTVTKKDAKISMTREAYFELATVPHNGPKCQLGSLEEATEYFNSIRASTYILATEDVPVFVLQGWLDAKKKWRLDVASQLLPTHSHPTIQAFLADKSSEMNELRLSVHTSIHNSTVTVNTDEGPENYQIVKVAL